MNKCVIILKNHFQKKKMTNDKSFFEFIKMVFVIWIWRFLLSLLKPNWFSFRHWLECSSFLKVPEGTLDSAFKADSQLKSSKEILFGQANNNVLSIHDF